MSTFIHTLGDVDSIDVCATFLFQSFFLARRNRAGIMRLAVLIRTLTHARAKTTTMDIIAKVRLYVIIVHIGCIKCICKERNKQIERQQSSVRRKTDREREKETERERLKRKTE